MVSLGLEGHLDKLPDQLSGGQRQRVAVARALANDPPLVLADEPTGSLDSKSSEQVFEILEALVRERGKTVIAVTHDVAMAERMDRRIHLVDGRIEARRGARARRPAPSVSPEPDPHQRSMSSVSDGSRRSPALCECLGLVDCFPVSRDEAVSTAQEPIKPRRWRS